MKATSNSRSKTAHSSPTTKIRGSDANGQLFLGHKVLGELRILMRLASPVGTSQENADTNSSHKSF